MGELSFVVKSFIFSALLISALQFRVGGSTLEATSEAWIRQAPLPRLLHEVAQGAVHLSKEVWSTVRGQFDEASEEAVTRLKDRREESSRR
ncbi:MAG TPA: hypothetical protein PLZ57_13225 [Pseudobdellovibrionaceae bacterium]|nr:hypothetical protein [Pseudobdellovibrionaceae bacterium]